MTMESSSVMLQLLKCSMKKFLSFETKMDEENRSILALIYEHFPSSGPHVPEEVASRPMMAQSTVGLGRSDLFLAVVRKMEQCASNTQMCIDTLLMIASVEIPITEADVRRLPALRHLFRQRVRVTKETLEEYLIDQEFLIHSVRYLFVRIVAEMFPLGLYRILDLPSDSRSQRTARQRTARQNAEHGRNHEMLDLNHFIFRIVHNLKSIKDLAIFFKEVFYLYGFLLYVGPAPGNNTAPSFTLVPGAPHVPRNPIPTAPTAIPTGSISSPTMRNFYYNPWTGCVWLYY